MHVSTSVTITISLIISKKFRIRNFRPVVSGITYQVFWKHHGQKLRVGSFDRVAVISYSRNFRPWCDRFPLTEFSISGALNGWGGGRVNGRSYITEIKILKKCRRQRNNNSHLSTCIMGSQFYGTRKTKITTKEIVNRMRGQKLKKNFQGKEIWKKIDRLKHGSVNASTTVRGMYVTVVRCMFSQN